MNRRRRLAFLAILLAWLAAGARPSSASSLRLVSPPAGAELVTGSMAAVEWDGAPPPSATVLVEWEAFLSLDGGRTYPIRITPHLDLSIRRFAFRVPEFPSRHVRLLLRFGDERREIEVETPQGFTIVGQARSWAPVSWPALTKGERPRPGDSGVLVWVEGSREGRGLREVVAKPDLLALRAIRPARLPWLPLVGPLRSRTDEAPPPASAVPASAAAASRRSPILQAASSPDRVSVRLLIHRFNE